MKKEILKSLIVCGLVTGLQAGGDIGGVVSFENPDANIVIPESNYVPVMAEPVVVPAPVAVVPVVVAPAPVVPAPAPKPKPVVKKAVPKGPSNFYTVLKGISTMGDTYNCNCTDSGYGAGIDLGYKLGNGFATELGLSYATNDLNNVSGDVSHKTGALSLVYTYPLTDVLGLFGKVGYMIENSSLAGSDNESGMVYGGGLEYGLGGNYAILGEYQATTIDSLRGDAASLGLKYNF
jgi:opacity protein-like surface antigen